MPQIESKIEIRDGRAVLQILAAPAPRSARLWTSTSDSPDVRSSAWSPADLRIVPVTGAPDSMSFVGEIPLPAAGFAGIFGELEFGGEGVPYRLTTQIYIVGGAGSAVPVR